MRTQNPLNFNGVSLLVSLQTHGDLRSIRLTAFLESLVHVVAERTGAQLEILTPTDPNARGCQLSVVAHGYGRTLFDHLMAHGVIVDWREPAVIRMAPVPLYNSFEDLVRFAQVLEKGLSALADRI